MTQTFKMGQVMNSCFLHLLIVVLVFYDDDSKKCDDDVQVSCLARGSDGRNLTVTQLAEKDQVIIMIY